MLFFGTYSSKSWLLSQRPTFTYYIATKGLEKRSLLLMVCNDGTFQYQIFKESVNAIKFAEYINTNNTIIGDGKVLLDNVSFHKSIKDNRFHFTPPYSPQFNPVEYCFSKIKGNFRKVWTSIDNFDNSLNYAIHSLTPIDIINCFQHVINIL